MQYSVRKSRIHANMSCESDVSPLNKYLITCYLILGKKKKSLKVLTMNSQYNSIEKEECKIIGASYSSKRRQEYQNTNLT